MGLYLQVNTLLFINKSRYYSIYWNTKSYLTKNRLSGPVFYKKRLKTSDFFLQKTFRNEIGVQ